MPGLPGAVEGTQDTMTALMLPGMPEIPEREPGDDRSRRKSWTAQARRLVGQGIHPLTRGKARPDLGHCGTCVHRVLVDTARAFPKCEQGPVTRGEHTDVRSWWPACDRGDEGYQQAPEGHVPRRIYPAR